MASIERSSRRLRSDVQKECNSLTEKENYVKYDTPTKSSQKIVKECVTDIPLHSYTPKNKKSLSNNLQLNDSDNEDQESKCSPPKRGKSNNTNKVPMSSPVTPSGLISRLQLNTPHSSSTKLTCDKTSVKNFTPKQLFASPGHNYKSACQALHSYIPTRLPGREAHLEKLEQFLFMHLKGKRSGSLYVSGPPGTGKTVCLQKVMESAKIKSGYKMVYTNCTSMMTSQSVYSRIANELDIEVSGKQDVLTCIEKYILSHRKMILLVLDEIDQLDSKKQSVLYSLFELPSKLKSKLVLIGIANALDLTDRILPRLQARLDMKPELLHFEPYSKQEIIDILADRLKQSETGEIFSLPALQLLAGKVAAVSGDVRRALDIGRRLVQMTEAQKFNEVLPLKTVTNACSLSSPTKCSTLHKNTSPSPVKIKEVMSVLNNVYGTSQKLDENEDDSFPLQQKILICTLILMLKKSNNKDITLGKFHEVYKRICQKRNILGVDHSEFLSLCELVETRGILRVVKRKESRLSKICLQWDEDEVRAALKDKQLLSDILCDTSCLKP